MLALAGNILMLMALALGIILLLPMVYILTRAGAVRRLCQSLAGLFEGINKTVSGTIMWAGLAMALVQLMVVIMRYVFGVNFIWMQEAIVYLFGFMFLLTAGYALLTDEHVRVDIFYRETSPRRKAFVNFIGTYLFLFPVCVLIIWAAGPYVARSWAVMEGSQEQSGIQAVFLLKSLIPAFAVLMAMAGFTLATKAALTLTGQEDS